MQPCINAIQTGGAPTAHQICSERWRRSLGVHSHDHHHGHFVGLTCQVQAQEITQEVILCKYSRQAHFRKNWLIPNMIWDTLVSVVL